MERFDPSVPAVVLKYHRGTLGIVRSLGRSGVAVHGVAGAPGSPVAASRYLRETLLHDVEAAPEAESLRFLDRLAGRIGRPAVLIPTSDRTARFVADHARALDGKFLVPQTSPEVVRTLVSKRDLTALAHRIGLPTPRSACPESIEEAARFCVGVGYPVLLKSIEGDLAGGERVIRIEDEPALVRTLGATLEPSRPNVLVQEWIPGPHATFWMFNGYFGRGGECLAAFCGRKLRQYPVTGGPTCLGVVESNPEIVRLTRELMRPPLAYHGPIDVDWVHDARDGAYKLLDVNPRIGATFRLFAGDDGTDLALALYRDLTGQPVPAWVPREGRRWIAEDKDVKALIGYRRRGAIGVGGWLRSLSGVAEAAWFAFDDPAPFLLMLRDLVRERSSSLRQRRS